MSQHMECNLCGGIAWGDQGSRKQVRCLQCNSLERTRALKLILDHMGIPKPDSNILHFAPETYLANHFSKLSPRTYSPVDFSPQLFPKIANIRKFDIIADSKGLPSDHYDLIVHSHVAEHISTNLAYFFFHFSRALKADGYHIFCVPILGGYYGEDFGPMTPEEATKRFGQKDHVRRFGVVDMDRHLGSFMRLPKEYDLGDYASVEAMELHNIPARERAGFHSSTIFVSRKDDYLLA